MKLTKRTTDGDARRAVGGPGGAPVHAREPRPRERSPWLDLPGAVEGEGVDRGVPAHLGRPAQEQWALEAGTAAVHLPLEVLTVEGPDRLTWLHSLTSQHLSALPPGASTEALVLDPHGHVAHAAAVVDDGERTWLLTEDRDGAARTLAEFLDSMRFALRVEVTERDDLVVLGLLRPRESRDGGHQPREESARAVRDAVTAGAAGPVWEDPWPGVADGSTSYGAVGEDHPGTAHRALLVPIARESLTALSRDLPAAGGEVAGSLAWEAARVARRRPRVVTEVDERALPHELDWLRTAVHLEKGCYRGQETVARVVNLGRPPRRLVHLHLDGSAEHLPQAGTPVLLGTREVGRVTSAVRHADDGPIALALVRRAVDPAAQVSVEGVAATQEIVVAPDGEPAHRPELPDRGALRRRDLK